MILAILPAYEISDILILCGDRLWPVTVSCITWQDPRGRRGAAGPDINMTRQASKEIYAVAVQFP